MNKITLFISSDINFVITRQTMFSFTGNAIFQCGKAQFRLLFENYYVPLSFIHAGYNMKFNVETWNSALCLQGSSSCSISYLEI